MARCVVARASPPIICAVTNAYERVCIGTVTVKDASRGLEAASRQGSCQVELEEVDQATDDEDEKCRQLIQLRGSD